MKLPLEALGKRCGQHNNAWNRGFLLASSTLLLSAIALPTQAATFTVQFTGVVDDLQVVSSIGFSEPTFESPTTLTTRNTGTTVSLADQLTGQYIFDDATGEITASRFRFVSPDSGTSLDPAIPDPSDITFVPLVQELLPDGRPVNDRFVSTSSQASATAARYNQLIGTLDTTAGSRFSLTEDQTFSYAENWSARGTGGGEATIRGTLNSLMVVDDSPLDPEDPTDIPEPVSVLALIGFAGLSFKRLQRSRLAQ